MKQFSPIYIGQTKLPRKLYDVSLTPHFSFLPVLSISAKLATARVLAEDNLIRLRSRLSNWLASLPPPILMAFQGEPNDIGRREKFEIATRINNNYAWVCSGEINARSHLRWRSPKELTSVNLFRNTQWAAMVIGGEGGYWKGGGGAPEQKRLVLLIRLQNRSLQNESSRGCRGLVIL